MNTDQILNALKNGKLNNTLSSLYDDTQLDAQITRYINAVQTFTRLFGSGDACIFSAPGRTEIGGNHTDHQHGHVLAASINLDAIAVARTNTDCTIKILSEGYDMISIDVSDIRFQKDEIGTTKALIKGILNAFLEHGYTINGFDAYITSDVFVGAGLSSSAALESIIGTILSHLYNNAKVSAKEIAFFGQFAENIYFGKPCGLMDQIACSVGGFVHIDFTDIQNPKIEQTSFDIEKYGYQLCIIDTKGSHADLTDDYAQIPIDMLEIANYFQKKFLNEIPPLDFYKALPDLAKKYNHRSVLRAFHFFEENNRVVLETDALVHGDFNHFLSLIKESGRSSFCYLQNVYTNKDITCQPISIALAASEHIFKDQGVCRIHGGGFAGTIQAFVKKEALFEYRSYMEQIFGKGSFHLLKIRDCGGIRVL